MQELASCAVRRPLLVELLLDGRKKIVKLSRLYHGPWDDLQLPRVKACDEVSVLLILNYLLEFESEPR